MSDELTKLAAQRCADGLRGATGYDDGPRRYTNGRHDECNLWRADKERAHHAAEKAKAALTMSLGGAEGPKLFAINEAIAALEALILTPPVDPLLVEARGIAADWTDQMPDFQQQIRRGEQDESPIVLATLAALKRTVADGGGA